MSFGARFLVEPGRVAALLDGPACGGDEVTIGFADAAYRFTGLSGPQAAAIGRRYGILCDPPREVPVVSARVAHAPAAQFVVIDTRGWTLDLDLDYAPTRVRFASHGFAGAIDPASVEPGVLVVRDGDDESFLGALENFFRVAVAYRHLNAGGVLLHSAGLVDEGAAFVFFGPSGIGKSTLTGRGAKSGRAVLSDELNALRRVQGRDGPRIVVDQLPFAGDFGSVGVRDASFPVQGLFRLRQAATCDVTPLSPGQAVGMMLSCAPFVNGDPHRAGRLLDTLTLVCDTTPVRALSVSLDGDIWPLLRSTNGNA